MTGIKSRILCTRPLDAALIGLAAGKGILIECLPFIGTETSVNESTRDFILRLSGEPIVAVFTSMNAVEAVAAVIDAPGLLRDNSSSGSGRDTGPASLEPSPWKVFCIGSATRRLAGRHFGEDSIAGTADSAGALASVILETLAGKESWPRPDQPEVFFFCGDQRRDELPEKLIGAGVSVGEIVVYRTLQTPHKLSSLYDAFIFFSPSAVHSFFSENSAAAGDTLFAIGNTTAETIRSYCGNRLIVGGSPDKEALVLQAIEYFSSDRTL